MDEDAVFEDGPSIGRFRVSKLKGLNICPAIDGNGASALSEEENGYKVKFVVLLFGWLTCQDKHLRKYAALYHEHFACKVVLRYTVPAGKVLRRKQSEVVRTAEDIMSLIPLFFPRAKVLVHYFSNGGCFVHRRLLLLLNGHYRQRSRRFCCDRRPPNEEHSFSQLAATIFDSCPAAADAQTGAKALSAALRAPFARLATYITIRFGLEVYGLAQCWRYERKYLEHIENDHLLIPSLYIYSDDDTITDAALVERIVTKRKAYFTSQGIVADVMVRTWKVSEPSSHVCHYAHHPDAYRAEVGKFLQAHGLL